MGRAADHRQMALDPLPKSVGGTVLRQGEEELVIVPTHACSRTNSGQLRRQTSGKARRGLGMSLHGVSEAFRMRIRLET